MTRASRSPSLRIQVVTPAPRASRLGNRVSADRWASLFRRLGHRVRVVTELDKRPCDLVVALHAKRGASAIRRSRRTAPDRPIVLVLTGTDVYRDIHRSRRARESLDIADRLVTLQPLAINELDRRTRGRARSIIQSARPTSAAVRPATRTFDVAVLAHLRPVKDPFRAALASRALPSSSRVRVLQLGAALSDAMERRALAEVERNSRYHWLGDVPRWRARRTLARSRVLVLSSLLEGGANVLCEAIADRVPVLASRIPGSSGILGRDYPGFFPVRDTHALASLLDRVETDTRFHRALIDRIEALAPLVAPERELAAWRELIEELK